MALKEIEVFEKNRKKQSGRPQKLSYGRQLKMYLTHLSYMFLGSSYGISKANAWKIVQKIENFLR